MTQKSTITQSVGTNLLGTRRVLVTGAMGAIGSAICVALAAHGAEVIRSDRDGGDGVLKIDVTDEASVDSGIRDAGPLTDIVHSAGSLTIGPIAGTELSDFREALNINLCGAFLVGRAAARQLGPGGSLTFISSQAGYRSGANWGTYCAAKAGVLRLSEALAQELGPRHIRVNSVCPGNVATPMLNDVLMQIAALDNLTAEQVAERYRAGIPMGRPAEPREIGNVCVFLISSLASYVSGVAIPVDGGEISA